jgi:integrase
MGHNVPAQELLMTDTMKKELTVKQLFELVIKDYRDEDKVTLSGVHNSMKHWERLGYMDRSAERLKTKDIEDYKEKRREEGASKGTLNIELSHLRRGFTLALEQDPPLIKNKVKIKAYYLGNTNRRTGWFEQADYDKLLPFLKHYQKQCLRFSYICGWRSSELFKLTWKDNYDEDNQCIRIYKSKNKDGWVLPLFDADGDPTELYDIIEEQKTYRSPETDFIFHYRGQQIIKSTFHGHWTAACELAGVKRHFHDLRRTASRNLRNAGVDQAERMAIIGHKTTTMDLRYGIVNEDDRHQKEGVCL